MYRSNHYLKEKELELQAFTTASQSVQQTLNLDYLIRSKSHYLGVWGLWICRSCTNQMMCVEPKALKVVMVKTKEAAHQDAGKAEVRDGLTLVSASLGWIMSPSPVTAK